MGLPHESGHDVGLIINKRGKFKSASVHLAVFSLFLFFNNCSGFSPAELEKLSSSSSFSNGPTPQPTPAVPIPGAEKTTIFLAQGKIARTLISCDDGVTWIRDRSDDDTKRCWYPDQTDPRYVECDHNPYSSAGVDYGEGWLFANYGWGYNGSVRRSADGITWETLRSDGWGGGVSYALGRLLLLWGSWSTSDDLGKTWTPLANRPPDTVVADHAFARKLKDRFAIVANSGIAISADKGQTWISAPSLGWPPHAIAEGNGILLAIGTETKTYPDSNILHAMRSTDGGKTWSQTSVTAQQYISWDQLVFNGTEFVSWGGGETWKSADGMTWTHTPLVTTGTYTGAAAWQAIGAVSYNATTGTYVTVTPGWNYDQQRAYRSTDGITWVELDSNHFKGGHPITAIITAEIDKQLCR